MCLRIADRHELCDEGRDEEGGMKKMRRSSAQLLLLLFRALLAIFYGALEILNAFA